MENFLRKNQFVSGMECLVGQKHENIIRQARARRRLFSLLLSLDQAATAAFQEYLRDELFSVTFISSK
jgi:hypothetical protein